MYTNDRLWYCILNYTTGLKNNIDNALYISDKMLKKKVAEVFIINKFLERWSNDILEDPLTIIDDLIINYSMWENNAVYNNNKDLLDIYTIYIKTLNSIKNYIIKENI